MESSLPKYKDSVAESKLGCEMSYRLDDIFSTFQFRALFAKLTKRGLVRSSSFFEWCFECDLSKTKHSLPTDPASAVNYNQKLLLVQDLAPDWNHMGH